MPYMTQMLLQSILIVLIFNLMGCSTETTQINTRSNSDEIDVSSWDFGEFSEDDSGFHDHPATDEEQYAIAVATFTGDGHEKAARVALSELIFAYPSIGRQLKVRKRSRGTVLTYGHYAGYDDPAAKAHIEMLRNATTAQGRALFSQLLLTKFRPMRPKQSLHPNNLWTIRREYPTIVPIYTLEVAVWGDFDSGQLPSSKRRAAAEQYASELRTKGYEAFFYHNDDSELSSVTVGLFSYKAIDAETGFYSPEVEAMLARFPQRLMNGQPVLEYNDPTNHAKGTRVQVPCLAEVPVD